MKLGKILHLGIVVADLDKAVKIYEEKLGVGPWEIGEPAPFFAQMNVNDGESALNIKTALYKGDGYEIELVMPIGEGLYQDWLNERGPGLHHVKFEHDSNFNEIITTAQEVSGRKPYLDVKWPDGRPMVAYADLLEEAGLLIEISALE